MKCVKSISTFIYLGGNEKMVDLLIKNGVNINQLTKDGSTPLSWAAYWGSLLK